MSKPVETIFMSDVGKYYFIMESTKRCNIIEDYLKSNSNCDCYSNLAGGYATRYILQNLNLKHFKIEVI
jgi:hypothetical protein